MNRVDRLRGALSIAHILLCGVIACAPRSAPPHAPSNCAVLPMVCEHLPRKPPPPDAPRLWQCRTYQCMYMWDNYIDDLENWELEAQLCVRNR